ncbi:hypothetical protein [Asaia spathodeae]|uniref:Uncharacterized protein n=1 Tax=Asaia spathodeae TaxID=657016 RepID=A0ABX2P7T5_9PROT|nr:hypothetical protein [Asaia spathodeae]GBR16496.1 hypothetical protein AA105894_1590 [Asaia spathodeae NBRC 105894]
MEESARKAVSTEETPNLVSAFLYINGNDMHVSFVFKSPPDEIDIEAIELMVTYIFADLWRWIGKIQTGWGVAGYARLKEGGKQIFSREAQDIGTDRWGSFRFL